MQGWIKLHRKFLEWEWYDDHNTKIVFLHLLLKASHVQRKWRSLVINPGDYKTDLRSLASEVGISIRSLRTSLERLKTTHEVAIKTSSKYTVVSINKWYEYQQNDTQDSKQTTNKRQTNDTHTRCTKNVKNVKNNISTLEENCFLFLNKWNEVLKTNKTSIRAIKKNLSVWLEEYPLEKILEAVEYIKTDNFWKDKMTPETFLRQKNPRGEDVNYIGMLLDKKPPSQEDLLKQAGYKI